MIRQHFLQQQRLNYNHDRLLDRYHRLLPPKISHFRPFGSSPLPGRNYDQYIDTINGNRSRRDSSAAQSRASIGSSSETYRWMGDGASETLPRNVTSVMQHTRQQPMPLVHAEKFEPVQVYEHPVFGPTPSYLRPVYNERQHLEEINDDHHSETEEDFEARSHTSGNISLRTNRKEEPKMSSTIVKKEDDNEVSDQAPKGYISYEKWKKKYENLVPVNPLLFNIYTQRPNGSINSYGQSLYVSPNYHGQSNRDKDVFTPPLSEIDSVSSEIPRVTSLSSHQRYNRLQPHSIPNNSIPRSLEPIHTGNESDSSDDEASPPDSPVPFLSRTRQNPITSTSLSTTIPSPSAIPTTVNTTGTPLSSLASINTINIPPAPPMPPSLATTSFTIPRQASSSLLASLPPIAPPMPTSLATSNSTAPYQAPSHLPTSLPPIAPPMPASLATFNSTAPYQTPSNVFAPPSNAGSTTKAVTFSGLPSISATIDDTSSSSDSDDDEKQKRRRRRRRQAAAEAGGGDIDSSSSDD